VGAEPALRIGRLAAVRRDATPNLRTYLDHATERIIREAICADLGPAETAPDPRPLS